MASKRSGAVPVVAAWVVCAVLAGGCGGSAGEESSGAARSTGAQAEFPVTVRAANGSVRVPHVPRRVVSLSPTATETLFAIGADRQVVAVDDQSNYPQEAPRTDISPSQPNLESIARYRPDLVVVSDTSPADLAGGLQKLGVTVLSEPSAQKLDDAYDQIGDLGLATGHREEAERVVERMRSRMERLFAAAPPGSGLSVYHELQPDLYAASSRTFIGGVYERLGLRNVADAAARKAGSDYPQLSSEYLVSADPDLIVLADTKCCHQSAATVRRRAGWGEIAAVRNGDVLAVDTDLAARWGPRLPQFVAQVVADLRQVRADGR